MLLARQTAASKTFIQSPIILGSAASTQIVLAAIAPRRS